ncbi:hypothetical protein FIBSPDRAFT_934093 [Athelia psychrophila]|uniref:Peptidase C19 ubiquitin carboxyl-terminal hydrolase domain-containing protein n=1 Tax=Athelia psychrophila TaxID=1759441 RepID=A0A166G2U7_9AGAM|nr:hypothetical protein FIBSPDRAFT_934093 [Fibularhizoctonia sp. CBS 109695]
MSFNVLALCTADTPAWADQFGKHVLRLLGTADSDITPFHALFSALGRHLTGPAVGKTGRGTPLVGAAVECLREFECSRKMGGRGTAGERQGYGEGRTSRGCRGVPGFYLDTLEEEMLSLANTLSPPVRDAEATKEGEEHGPEDDGWLEVGTWNRMVTTHTIRTAESLITRMLGAKFRSMLRAQQKNSSTIEGWRTLQLDIQISAPSSAQMILPTWPGVIIGGSQQVLIETAPPVLVLHMMRFMYDTKVNSLVKIGKEVSFGPELAISPEIKTGARRGAIQAVKWCVLCACCFYTTTVCLRREGTTHWTSCAQTATPGSSTLTYPSIEQKICTPMVSLCRTKHTVGPYADEPYPPLAWLHIEADRISIQIPRHRRWKRVDPGSPEDILTPDNDEDEEDGLEDDSESLAASDTMKPKPKVPKPETQRTGCNVGPIWRLLEDRAWYKETIEVSAEDAVIEAKYRPRVHTGTTVNDGLEIVNQHLLQSALWGGTENRPALKSECSRPAGCVRFSLWNIIFLAARLGRTWFYFPKANITSSTLERLFGAIHPEQREVTPLLSRLHPLNIDTQLARPSKARIQIWSLSPAKTNNDMDDGHSKPIRSGRLEDFLTPDYEEDEEDGLEDDAESLAAGDRSVKPLPKS